MCLIVNRASRFLAEARVSFGMVKGKVAESEVLELVDSESQNLGNVSWLEGILSMRSGTCNVLKYLNVKQSQSDQVEVSRSLDHVLQSF